MSAPSSTFESLIAIASDDAQLRATLSKHLYPALDALPAAHAQKLTKALRDAEEEFRYMKILLNKMDYAGRKRLFEADLKAARDSRDINVWRTTEEKWLGAIGDWLSTLWQLGVEKGHERQLVWKCLMFCEEVMRRTVPPPDITVEWPDPCADVHILDSSGRLVFEHTRCPLGHALAWMWIDLLIASLAADSDPATIFVKDAVTALQQSNMSWRLQAVLGAFPYDNSAPYTTIAINDLVFRYTFSHWPLSKREKLPELHKLFFAPEIRAFKASPTYSHFDSLVDRFPCLQDALISVTHQKVHDNARSRDLRIEWKSAVAIYCKWSGGIDVINLDRTLAVIAMDEDVFCARLALFRHYATTKLVPWAESTMKDLLQRTIVDCWRQIAQPYPGWDDAWEWLQEVVQDGQLTMKVLPNVTVAERMRRDVLLLRFAALLKSADSSASAAEEEPAWTGRKRGIERGNRTSPWGLAHDVRRCLMDLDSSPDGVKRVVDIEAAMKRALDNDYLVNVDGVFDALHDNTSEPLVRAGLHALRDLLRGEWDVNRDYTGSVDARVERPAKKARTEQTQPRTER